MESAPNNQSLLVCVDGSDYTEPSLRYALWLAKMAGVESIVVSHISDIAQYQVPFINELGAGIGLQPCNGLFNEIRKQELDRIEALKIRVNELIGGSAYSDRYHFVVQQGKPTDLVTELPEGYRFVVLGKRGDSFGEKHEHLGSNLDRFLKMAKVPCLLASRAFSEVQSLTIVLDDEENTDKMAGFFEDKPMLSIEEIQVLHSQNCSQAMLQKVSAALQSKAHKIHFLAVDKHSDHAVVEHVNTVRSDMILIGNSHASGLFGWVHTPVAKAILKKCRVPLLYFP